MRVENRFKKVQNNSRVDGSYRDRITQVDALQKDVKNTFVNCNMIYGVAF